MMQEYNTELDRSNKSGRTKLIDELETMLGGGMVDVELQAKDYNLAIDLSLARYRQRAENAVEESYIFLNLEQARNDYTLPNEIMEVRGIYRRGFGMGAQGGMDDVGNLDPFSIAFTNIYILQDSNLGGLASYDFYAQNMELAGRMFGQHYNYVYNSATKRLKIQRNIRGEQEEVLLWVYNYIPEDFLFKDTYAGPWIRSYAFVEAKLMLGSAYEKFASLGGPQGGINLNGSQLKSEAIQERQELDDQLKKYQDGSLPLGFIMG